VILGETGTGKEVAARGIHRASGRRGSFQAINCAAIPPSLLESELFGYRRGAFSGADRDKPGLIKLADGGTLFLDEIGDMPLDAQAKLLRVLQAREVFPLGATTAEHVNIRVACATHRDLNRLVKEGKFRGDLFARLNEHVVRLPPLRERKEDVYQLARSFTARYGRPRARASRSPSSSPSSTTIGPSTCASSRAASSAGSPSSARTTGAPPRSTRSSSPIRSRKQ